MDTTERRRFRRAATSTTASLFTRGRCLGRYRIDNLSAGGALVAGPPISSLRVVRIHMELPTGRLSVNAEIVRKQLDDDETQMAVLWDHDPSRETEDKIHDAVLHVLELNHEGRGVLIVDDFDPVRKALEAQVRDLGYAPYCASCYDEALDQLHSAPVVFDAALLDLDLAGESGWDIAENLSAYYPDIRRVVMSGRYHPSQLDLATSQGLAHARLAKPWTEDDLVDALRPKAPA